MHNWLLTDAATAPSVPAVEQLITVAKTWGQLSVLVCTADDWESVSARRWFIVCSAVLFSAVRIVVFHFESNRIVFADSSCRKRQL